VLPDDGTVQIAGQTDSSLTLTGEVPSIKPGDVLVSSAGYGLLRKVVGVQRSRGAVIVQTEQGTLEDVFQQLDFHFSKTLTPDDIILPETLPEGVTILRGRSGSRVDVFTVEVAVRDKVLYGSKKAGILASGILRFKLGFDVASRIMFPSRLVYFHATVNTAVEAELQVKANVSFKRVESKQPLLPFPIYGKPIWVPTGTFVPLIFVPVLDIYAGFEGTAATGLELAVVANVTCKAGCEFANGFWRPVGELNPNLELPSGFVLNPYLNLSAQTYTAVESSLLIYGLVGPYFRVKDPYVEGSWTFKPLPGPTYVVDLFGGVQADAGAKVEVLGRTLARFDKEGVLDFRYHFPLFPMTFFGSGDVPVVIQ
jgi:hypothetical protein